jgi:hypothetical protein
LKLDLLLREQANLFVCDDRNIWGKVERDLLIGVGNLNIRKKNWKG